MRFRQLPCNSEWAVTCHSNEVANFLVTQRHLLTLGSFHRAPLRAREWVQKPMKLQVQSTRLGEGWAWPDFAHPTPPPTLPRSSLLGISPLWHLISPSRTTLCRLFSPDLHLHCSCHLEHLLCSL